MLFRKLAVSLAAVGLALAASTAQAALISETFDVTAAGFGAGAPVDPVNLVFTVDFNNSTSFGPTTSGLTVDSFNLPYTTEYEYDQSTDILTVATAPLVTGNAYAPYAGYYDNPNSYGTFIGNASTLTPNDFGFSYETADGSVFNAAVTSATVAPAVSAAPEPVTWAMMILGLGAIGLMMRHARKNTGVRLKYIVAA